MKLPALPIHDNSSPLNRTTKLERTVKNPQDNTDSLILTPAQTVCDELQGAISHFNIELFKGELDESKCMVTLDFSGKTHLGFYAQNRFANKEGQLIDQISLNAKFVIGRSVKDVCSTIVHELCHYWERRYTAKPTKGAYHGKRWAEKMKEVGLHPSSTGQPGGDETGNRVSHYPIPGGRFEQVVEEMLKHGFAITWGAAADELHQQMNGGGDSDGNSPGNDGDETPPDQSKGKVKFSCPKCNQNAWGAASLRLKCDFDNALLLRA